jgi:pimeloyl-ACP methyl ester carboxylesterase
MPLLHDQLAAYIRAQKLERPVLVGVLFGASVAYWLAETEPDLLGGVVAVDTPPSRFDGALDPEAAEGRDAMAKAPPDKFHRMVAGRYQRLMKDAALAKELADKAAQSSQAVVADAFYDSMTRDLRPGIPNIHTPLLVLLTTESVPAEARQAQEEFFQEQLKPVPQHELVVVPGAHHFVMLDAPDTFFAQLDRFLATTPGDRGRK